MVSLSILLSLLDQTAQMLDLPSLHVMMGLSSTPLYPLDRNALILDLLSLLVLLWLWTTRHFQTGLSAPRFA
jgi:hypothetical protein